ncbi:MAG: hypothetical protein ACR2HI_04275 [Gaiella sp.]
MSSSARSTERPASSRSESERFDYDDPIQRDKASFDLTWLRDEPLEDLENLPPPEVIAQEIIEELGAALAELAEVAAALGTHGRSTDDRA